MRCWPESHTHRNAGARSCGPGLAGDLSLGSAELVTFLTVVQNRTKSSLKEKQLILLGALRREMVPPSGEGRTSWPIPPPACS